MREAHDLPEHCERCGVAKQHRPLFWSLDRNQWWCRACTDAARVQRTEVWKGGPVGER